MRRWRGWGDDTVDYALTERALGFITHNIGEASPLTEAPLEEILAGVPKSRLPDHPLVAKTPMERLLHARGQSLPDWLAMHSGRLDSFPDGISCPASSEEVRSLLLYAQRAGASVISYGGGTSVVGHITPESDKSPVLTMDMGRMNRLLDLDEESLMATFEAGAAGPEVESQLRARGYTLGHFPQSFELSTLGGWIATRSSGQQSLGYGRIEQMFA